VHVLTIVATVFVLIFLGELPDKTMFATLVLGTRGHRLSVWLGAASAFLVHVVIAVTAGGLLSLAPHWVVAAIAAALFALGAVYVLREDEEDEAAEAAEAVSAVDRMAKRRTYATAFLVIFLAEWGDLTQILTANLAARYADPVVVGAAAVAGLWSVSALAVAASRLLARLPMTIVRRTSAVVMLGLAVWSALSAAGIG
jgi:putative Ca2+/H+ antiporter (TMEM165/GDT1 family)